MNSKNIAKTKKPGEEYELVQHWANDLKLDKYFELIDENDFRNKRTNIDGLLTSIEEDPFGIEEDKEFKKEQTDTFLKSQKEIGINMAVVMFMVDAMQYFKNLSAAKVKEIALEIAMLGTQGINPAQGNNYKLSNIPNKDFSGYHLLAYYYVSWKQAIPDQVDKLELEFEKEYAMAKQMKQEKKKEIKNKKKKENFERAKMRMTASEYSMPVLGLIFLRHAFNRFEKVREDIEKNLPVHPQRGKRKVTPKDFEEKSAMFLPEDSRFDKLVSLPEATDLGEAIDKAMKAIEEINPKLIGILPKNYSIFSKDLLQELLRIFNKEVLQKAEGDVFGKIYEYFLNKFAMTGAQEGGEFFTPFSLVQHHCKCY